MNAQDGFPEEALHKEVSEPGPPPPPLLHPLPALRHLLPHLPQQVSELFFFLRPGF